LDGINECGEAFYFLGAMGEPAGYGEATIAQPTELTRFLEGAMKRGVGQ
jgi:hypothetical protein